MTTRRRSLLTGFAATLALAPPPAGAVQSIPSKRPLTILLGFPEGTPADRTARDFVRYLAPHLPGNHIAPTNMPGDAGRTMLAALGDAPPNGMTIAWVTTPTLPARMIDRGEPSLGQRIQLLGQIERDRFEFRLHGLHEREETTCAGADIEQRQLRRAFLCDVFGQRNISAPAHRFGRATEQRFHLEIIELGRMLAQIAVCLKMEILAIIAG